MTNTYTPLQQQQLDNYLAAVLLCNKTINLTRIDSSDSGKLLHIEDSLIGLPELLTAPEGRCADMGSGGGFPGVPLSIVSERPFLLIDSVAKKMAAVQSIVDELNLSSLVSTFGGRTEELALQQPEAFAVITARALSLLPSLLELAAPLLKHNGHLICYKAQPSTEEIDQALSLETKLGMKLISKRDCVLSDGETQRCILVFEKIGEPQVKLPRRPGMAQKRPYRD